MERNPIGGGTEGREETHQTKTVLKIKDEQDGTQRLKSRIVTLGFSMIPGKDYTDSFSPVATDASVRLVIGLSLYIINRRKALRYTINTRRWE
jgi:hypothetical protein